MIDYIVFFIGFYVFFLLLSIFFKNFQNIFIFILIIFLAVFGINNIEELSLDYYNYKLIFDISNTYGWGELINFGDPLFLYLVKFLYTVFQDYKIIFLILIILSLLLKYVICIKFVQKSILPIFIFLLIGRFYILHDLTQIRASFAIGLLTIALLLYYKNNFVLSFKIIFIYIIGVLFHISILIVLFLIFFIKRLIRVNNFIYFYLFVVVSICLGYFLSNYLYFIISNFNFIDRVGLYFSGDGESQNVKYSVFQFYFILKFLVLMLLSNYYIRMNDFQRALVVTYVYAMCLQALFVFSSAIGLRFAAIFGYIDILVLLMPLTISYYKKYYNPYFVLVSLVGVVFFYSALLTIGTK